MNSETQKRIFMSFVFLAMAWLLISGFLVVADINELRSKRISNCLEKIEICVIMANLGVNPTLLQWFSPFLPAGFLLWLAWLFRLELKIDEHTYPSILMKWLRRVTYLACLFFVAIPFFLILEKSVDRLEMVSFSGLFLFPWIGLAWISASLLFQKLHGPEVEETNFRVLYRLLYVVIAAPFFALILLIFRELLKI